MRYLISLVVLCLFGLSAFGGDGYFTHREVTSNTRLFGKRTRVFCVGKGCPKCSPPKGQVGKAAPKQATPAPAPEKK
jgi:hypothetical protein